MEVAMSLDDIIASRPKNDRRNNSNRGKARAQVLGNPGLSPAARARAKAIIPVKTPAAPTSTPAEKIIVSNLPQDVNEAQVKELFHTTVGPLREVTLHYDANGRSKGVATVIFSKKGDGNRAFAQYNNRLIDGRRPMKIEIVVDPSRPAPPATLASRVAPAPAASAAATNTPRAGAPRGRGGGRRGRGGRSKGERTPKTAADLDAEMEDYTASSAPAAAA
ncbi:RRM domain-containing protein [Mycena venus]|uniref:RRM domain-containing protein n=1 Tax=Mycena venus TaxID=2733690 RepID=A0A8H6YMA0_9AGAR|nr:RRM domain-containing protein [Mycena venus]KAF7360485.1 RRM domain-containing protein [Mycena venus]